MRETEITILGSTWYVTSMPEMEYENIHNENKEDWAFTEPDLSTITINDKYLTFDTIAHELFHAYVECCCAAHSGIDKVSFEEVAADIVGKYGRTLIKQAEQILKEFKDSTKDKK